MPAQASVHGIEVREYSHDFGVSDGDAASALAIQDRGAEADIVDSLEQRLGSHFAGVWFDNRSGEFVVPVLPGANRDALHTELAAEDLNGDYRTAPVQYGWDKLVAVHEQLDRDLLPLIHEGLLATSVDPRRNAVVVQIAKGASGSQRAQVQRQASNMAVSVDVEQMRDESAPERQSCSIEAKSCGYPLRGGVVLGKTGGGACTAGFKAIGKVYGNRFILTAGHCAKTWPTFYAWDANDPGPLGYTEKEIGSTAANNYPSGDWAAINANGSQWDGNPWPSEIAAWEVDNERTINYESSSYLGEYVCHSGEWTGTSCGYVSELDQTRTFTDGTTTYHMTKWGPICSHGGDSGGPVFIEHTALGILVGATGEGCSVNGYYNEITEIDDSLGVTVGTGAGAPPFAETWDANNSFGTQVTGNGKVDPNGMPTTYRFEYGTTTAYGSATESFYAGAGMYPVPVSATISGLQAGKTYHYRISSSNGLGQSNGGDKTFQSNGWRYMLGPSSGGTTISSWNSIRGETVRPAKMALGDFTGDKKADIIAAEAEAGGKYRYVLGTSNGSGIASWSTLLSGAGRPWQMAVGDVTGDGKADVVAVESDGTGKFRYMLGISTGTTISWNHVTLTGMSFPTFTALGDVNGDGKADVVSVESEGNGSYRYMLGISTGTSFSWGFTSLTHMSGPWDVALADITGDKKADIVAVEDAGGGSFRYMRGISTGTNFSWGYLLTGMSAPYAMLLGDVNGDGKADIVADESEGGVKYRYMFGLSTGDGIWPWGYALTGLRVQESVGVGDFTGDGKADVVAVEAY